MTKTIAIIGASSGLGRATARTLARSHRVIACGRDVERTRAAVPGAAEVLAVELGTLTTVQRLADDLERLGPIDALVCNAGVQHTGTPSFTHDGFEETFAVNHLAHFALATRLAGGVRRVVFVASATHHPDGARTFGFRGGRYSSGAALAAGQGDPEVDDAQRARDRYATSKLCNLLATYALARRGVDAYAFDPGLMPGTGLARERGALQRLGWHTILRAAALVIPRASTAARSGRALAWLATSDELDREHRYYDFRRRPIEPWLEARRDDWADELYGSSVKLVSCATH